MTLVPLTMTISVAAATAATTTTAFNTATAVTVATSVVSPPPSSKRALPNRRQQAIDVIEKYFQLPEMIRFGIAGVLGNMMFFAIDKVIYNDIIPLLAPTQDEYDGSKTHGIVQTLSFFLNDHREATSFFVSYLIQIVAQHSLNALLVFGWDTINTREKYLKTLVGVYSAYSSVLVVSTILNAVLINIGVQKDIAFWGTLAGTGVLNYYLLSWLATRKNNEDDLGPSLKSSRVRGGGNECLTTASMVLRGGGSGGRMLPTLHKKDEVSILFALKTILFGDFLKDEREEELLQFVRSL
mmetsp:Transcript_9112/g.13495  ORF Transcript_9112/g.13495 Transcript_9112/m.13495 type:complete len:297 (-) Transcript_9112:431-1321(-)